MSDFPYIVRWDRMGRKGQRCRILTPTVGFTAKIFGDIQVQFKDGKVVNIDRQALKRTEDTHGSTRTA